MPGTRYSATFDRTYVEESPPAHSPVRFSIQSWQGASLPPGNTPLNGSYKHHAQTASTDSLDSSGTGASSTSSGSGTGHFTQMSLDCPGDTFVSARTAPKTVPINKNALQFVKVGPVPLYKKAVEQIQQTKEVRVAKNTDKVEEEQWQNNLDSWKSRRKKLSERAIQRVEDLKLLTQEEPERPSRTRTFSEMMENRATKPRGYNLSIYVENESQDFLTVGSNEPAKREVSSPDPEPFSPRVQNLDQKENFLNSSTQEKSQESQSTTTTVVVATGTESEAERDHVSSITVDYGCEVYPEVKRENGNVEGGDPPCSNSKGSSVVCVEEDCNGCGLYTLDSGLESFSSSQRVGDIQDSSSELSVDSSGGFDRGLNEDEADGQHSSAHLGEGGEVNPSARSQQWTSDIHQKTDLVQLNLRLWLNPETKDKDFGFGVTEEKGSFTVDSVKAKGSAWQGGLRPGDQVLAVNGESTSGRSKNSITFAMKQSIYNGHLDLIVSRSNNEDTKDDKENFESAVPEAEPIRISCSENLVTVVKQNGHHFDERCRSVEMPTEDAFVSHSRSDSLQQSWDEREQALQTTPAAKKKLPPPVPAKPKLSSTAAKTQDESDSHAPMVRTISNEMKLERMCSGVEYMPLDCVSDISQEMRDAEDELDQEMVVYHEMESPGGEPADLMFCVEQDPLPVTSDLRSINSSTIESDQGSKHCEREPLSESVLLPLHHVKEENGLNIIFESHPSQSSREDLLFSTDELVQVTHSESVSEEEADVGQQSEVSSSQGVLLQQQDVENVLQSLVTEVENVLPQENYLDSTQEVDTELHDESQESEWVQEELSAICPEEPDCTLDSLSLVVGDPDHQDSVLHPDDQLLVDLVSSALVMDPPKEKPPPPPPADSPEQVPKMNTFKRVKKDLWKRRSDFLGIDASGDEIDVDVPPPPDLSEILKSELDLERQNRLWLEKERFLSSSSSCGGSTAGHERTSSLDSQVTDEEIAQREREIIDNLEREEKAKHSRSSSFDTVDKGGDSGGEQPEPGQNKEDDERIVRLQVERRRMEEERFQREEVRIRAEEERIFKEREDQLRRQEDLVSKESARPVSLANPPPSSSSLNGSVFKDSRPVILPKPNRLSQNLDKACPDSTGMMDTSGLEKEALELERIRLQRDQERLQKEKEEYRRHMDLEQRKNPEMKADSGIPSDRQQGSEKTSPQGTLTTDRDAVIFASKKPQGLSEMVPDSSQNVEYRRSTQGLSAQGSDLASPEGSAGSQQLNRNALHFLGAAPKARIIQSEQWISQQDTASKRRSDPIIGMSRERGYNQNHWLVQEAEIRRITEQNERQQQLQHHAPPDHRRHSASAALRNQGPLPPPPPGVSSATMPVPVGPGNKLPRHIASTMPRPYQRMPPPPPPPPKPPHGMPIQGVQLEQPWNYRPVASVGGLAPKYRSESVIGVPSSWTKAPEETQQPEHLLSVSGKERCSHCAEPLGCGGAMIIESLQLYYHMHCFSCCVCQAPLGNGTCGTDVRVRNQKLHCQNCYSNDEAGLKFSQV